MIELEYAHPGRTGKFCMLTQRDVVKKALPSIVFYHGFTSSNVVYSYFAVALAQAGFRVVMPNAAEHGERFNGDGTERLQHFWQILVQNFTEFPTLRDALLASGLVSDGRLAVAGASMGGMTALGLMAQHPGVKCVASLMGSGYFSSLSQRYSRRLRQTLLRRHACWLRWRNGISGTSWRVWRTGLCCYGMEKRMM
ncbi:esterase [Escherichia coli]